jgi:ABC-type hemin transport system substrate-binding protein
VQSSRSTKALRIFYLQRRSTQFGWTVPPLAWVFASALMLVAGATSFASSNGEDMAAKRRQQGILTGMPFMANVAPRTFVDDLGRKIFLAKAPIRIVSLAPSITETLYAIGSGEQIVGVTEFCNFPPEAQSKPKVGYSHANIESIVALQPDLVLAPREFLRTDVLGKLEQLKIATFILEARTVEDIPAKIQTVGRILDRSQTADRLAMEVRQQLKAIRSRKAEKVPGSGLSMTTLSRPSALPASAGTSAADPGGAAAATTMRVVAAANGSVLIPDSLPRVLSFFGVAPHPLRCSSAASGPVTRYLNNGETSMMPQACLMA